jgi:predicted TPR repeat methyltransferase
MALNQLRRPVEAGPCFERVVQLAPARAEAWFHLAQTWQLVNQPERAVQAYDGCLALRPQHAASWSQRGTALRDLGRHDEAAASFERALALGDDSGLNAWYLAALRGGSAPASAPRGYVQQLFDDYADEFDHHLVDQLGYCAPEVLQRLLVGLGREPFEHGLDLGCGTGLCGPLLRPLAQRLTGVDLSQPMLDAARRRGSYDALLQADLVDHLAGTDDRHDLVVAADVFIYVGDLTPVFSGVRRVLQPGGVFAFSVEPAPAGPAWVLQPSLRYAHGDAALRALAAANGLQVQRVERGALRVDEVYTVQGEYWVMTAA